jgi:hypothetical protein
MPIYKAILMIDLPALHLLSQGRSLEKEQEKHFETGNGN